MKKQKGFTLLIAIVTTSLLLLVSFVVMNLALEQTVIAISSQASQHAFYASDSALECAIYWDVKNPVSITGTSAFDPNSPNDIECNGNNIPITATITVNGLVTTAVSTFNVALPDGCADVVVTKNITYVNGKPVDTQTQIDSQGYNTCDASSLRRFARGITISY